MRPASRLLARRLPKQPAPPRAWAFSRRFGNFGQGLERPVNGLRALGVPADMAARRRHAFPVSCGLAAVRPSRPAELSRTRYPEISVRQVGPRGRRGAPARGEAFLAAGFPAGLLLSPLAGPRAPSAGFRLRGASGGAFGLVPGYALADGRGLTAPMSGSPRVSALIPIPIPILITAPCFSL
jgi:hypothetical protein